MLHSEHRGDKFVGINVRYPGFLACGTVVISGTVTIVNNPHPKFDKVVSETKRQGEKGRTSLS